MPIRALVLALSFTPLLIACGSGGSGANPPTANDNTVRTGQFSGLSIAGLHYQTASRSGLTDANGRFEYVAGEQIHFSLGGIELGSTQAQASINLLAELPGTLPDSLPTTRDAMLEELASLNDVTDFDRIINIATLLMALDTDKNSRNGIDLGDLHSRMQSVTLDFHVPMSRFLDRRNFREVVALHGKRIDLPYKEVILALYQALALRVADHRINQIIETHEDGPVKTSYLNYGSGHGVGVARTACQHTPAGKLCTVDVDTDGETSTIEEAKLFTRDNDGDLIHEDILLGASTQTAPAYKEKNTYTLDPAKRLSQWLHEKNGLAQWRQETTYTPFNQTESVRFFNLRASQPQLAESEEHSIYNPTTLNEEVRSLYVGSRAITTMGFGYDAQSNAPALTLIDYDDDGNLDDASQVYHYDTPDSLDHRIEFDLDGDDVKDLEQTFVHDAYGHLNTYTGLLTDGDDSWREQIIDHFNHLGQLVQSLRDTDADDSPEWILDYDYDANGLIEQVTQTRYVNGNEAERITVQIDHVIDEQPLADGLAQILAPEYGFFVRPLIETCILNESEEDICH